MHPSGQTGHACPKGVARAQALLSCLVKEGRHGARGGTPLPVGEMVDCCRFGIDDRNFRTSLRGKLGEPGCRVNGSRGADDEQELGIAGGVRICQRTRGNGLAEPHHCRAHHATAFFTPGWFERFAGRHFVATVVAAVAQETAMELDHIRAASLLVQAVNVLGNDGD